VKKNRTDRVFFSQKGDWTTGGNTNITTNRMSRLGVRTKTSLEGTGQTKVFGLGKKDGDKGFGTRNIFEVRWPQEEGPERAGNRVLGQWLAVEKNYKPMKGMVLNQTGIK